MAQLLLLVTYTARPGMREEFVQKVREAGILEAIRNENGCIRYDYFYSEEDETSCFWLKNGKRRNVSASIWSSRI